METHKDGNHSRFSKTKKKESEHKKDHAQAIVIKTVHNRQYSSMRSMYVLFRKKLCTNPNKHDFFVTGTRKN